jgi:hypothetical protein
MEQTPMLRSRTVEEPAIHPTPMDLSVLKAQHQTVPRVLQLSPVSLVTVMPSQQLLPTALVMTSRWNIISLEELTIWNPVLGYPDGHNCTTQFWTGYDYCKFSFLCARMSLLMMVCIRRWHFERNVNDYHQFVHVRIDFFK